MMIQRREKGHEGMFYMEKDGEIMAELLYHMASPKKMVIEHTDVEDELRGQNIGFELVRTAVEYAREHNIKITVWCPFAKKVFEKNPDWADVLED
jgi:hypothetical protein